MQECIPKPRCAPTYDQFEESEEAFFEVLEELEPDVVLVWGTRLWNNLPCTNFENWSDCEYGGCYYRSGVYTTASGHKVAVYELEHPSAYGYDWEWWHEFMQNNDIL